jgi:hypothetical protein
MGLIMTLNDGDDVSCAEATITAVTQRIERG